MNGTGKQEARMSGTDTNKNRAQEAGIHEDSGSEDRRDDIDLKDDIDLIDGIDLIDAGQETQEDNPALQGAGPEEQGESDPSIKVIKGGFTSHEYDARDIVLDVLGFFLTVGVAFGWMLLMLLIISFVSLSYLHFDIRFMLLAATIFGLAAAVVYIVKKVKKYRRLAEIEKSRKAKGRSDR